MHDYASALVEKTFVISENRDDNMTNQAVKVFGNSKALKGLIADNDRSKL